MRWLSSPPDDDADSTTVFRSPAPTAIVKRSDAHVGAVLLEPGRPARRAGRGRGGGRRSSRPGRCPVDRAPRVAWNSAGKKRSSRHSRKRVGTSGHRSSGHGSSNRWLAGSVTWCADSEKRSSATSWKKVSCSSNGSGDTKPVLVHQSPADSRGAWHHRRFITSRSDRTRAHTRGPTKPPSDWATTIILPSVDRCSWCGGTASTTTSARSPNVACSSPHGRSTATVS